MSVLGSIAIGRWVSWGGVLWLVFCLLPVHSAQPVSKSAPASAELSWNRFDKALVLARTEKRPILVDFYTDWCSWCKEMDKQTYANRSIREKLGKSFVLAKVNAESGQTLTIQGKTLTEAQLAKAMRVNTYPTAWFFDPSGKPILPVKGYFSPQDFEPVLAYIEGGWYAKMDYDRFLARVRKRGA